MKTVKNKWTKQLSFWVAAFLLCVLAYCASDVSTGSYDAGNIWGDFVSEVGNSEEEISLEVMEEENAEGTENILVSEEEPGLEVHFIDVGQGDCTLLLNEGHAMLIDAGEDRQGTKVQKYLQKQGVEKLDYVIASHPDADHIGGLDVILTKFDCETILFTDAKSDTAAYRNVMEAIRYRGYTITTPKVGEKYSFGNAVFTIVSPVGTYDKRSNNYSIGLKVSFGENSFLFIGDTEKEAQTDMLQSGADLEADVLKAGHHGSSDSADKTFLEAVDAEYTVISCGKGNDYGHPHAKTLHLFQELDMQVFRTDEQGTITAISNGREITWSHAPSETWQAGVYGGGDEEAGTPGNSGVGTIYGEDGQQWPENVRYILNIGSYKFHKPECESVADMGKRNQKTSDLSREEIIEMGYSPCKRCEP